jgi:hypothetical protein
MDPSYIVDLIKGTNNFILIGDNDDGDVGMYINSILPGDAVNKVNVEFDTRNRIFYKEPDSNVQRGRFLIKTTKDIMKGQELIGKYGHNQGYWKRMREHEEHVQHYEK